MTSTPSGAAEVEDELVDESLILEAEGFNGEKMDLADSEDGVPGHHEEAKQARSPSTPKKSRVPRKLLHTI